MFQRINNRLMLTDTFYKVGKKFVQIIIPAISSLYFGLANIWGLPAAEQVVGTLALLATFGGVCLSLSSKHYDESGAALIELAEAQNKNSDGQLVVETNEETGNKIFSLQLNGDPEDLTKKSSIIFKVEPKQ